MPHFYRIFPSGTNAVFKQLAADANSTLIELSLRQGIAPPNTLSRRSFSKIAEDA
jgi:hypothetical protein